MKKKKKLFGIPLWIFLLFIFTAVAIAAGAIVLTMKITIQQPTHETLVFEFGKIPAGYETQRTAETKLMLPSTYDLLYELDGDVDKFTSIVCKIVAKDELDNTLGVPLILTKTTPSGTYEDIPSTVRKVIFEIKVTPKLELKTGTVIYEDEVTLEIKTDVKTA